MSPPGQGFPQDITAGGALVIPQVYSPNFSTASSTGWAILADGSAYFYNVTVSGTVTASTFVGDDFTIDQAGAFFYSGTPALGNLILSVAGTAGTDALGNAFLPGTATYSGGVLAVSYSGTGIEAWSASGPGGPWSNTGGTITLTAAVFDVFASAGINLDGTLTATAGTAADPTVITTDTWHTLSLGASWSGTLQCRMNADRTVGLRSQGTLTVGTRTTGTAIATVPTAYQPAFQTDMPLMITANSSGAAAVNSPFITIATAGTITIANVSTQVATNVAVLGAYPLD
jgi:hypothetical protein